MFSPVFTLSVALIRTQRILSLHCRGDSDFGTRHLIRVQSRRSACVFETVIAVEGVLHFCRGPATQKEWMPQKCGKVERELS